MHPWETGYTAVIAGVTAQRYGTFWRIPDNLFEIRLCYLLLPLGLETKNYLIGAAAAGSASEVSTQDPRCRDLAVGGGGGERPSTLITQMSWALIHWFWGWYFTARDGLEELDYHVQQEFSCIWYPTEITSPMNYGRDVFQPFRPILEVIFQHA